MKYLKQFFIIMAVTFIGEVLKMLIPLPIPASIYGLILMFLLLQFKIIRLDSVRECAEFLVAIMPIMFIPAGAGLIDSYADIDNIIIQIIVLTVITTILVMGVSGVVTQLVIEKKRKQDEHNE